MNFSTNCIPETAGPGGMNAALLASLVHASPAVLCSCEAAAEITPPAKINFIAAVASKNTNIKTTTIPEGKHYANHT